MKTLDFNGLSMARTMANGPQPAVLGQAKDEHFVFSVLLLKFRYI